MEYLLVGFGGLVGAICRYAIAQRLRTHSVPVATLVVNAIGSFVLGLVLVTDIAPALVLLVGVGFCGAFTTYSSFSFETVDLWERQQRAAAVANAAGNLFAAGLGFAIAWWVGTTGLLG